MIADPPARPQPDAPVEVQGVSSALRTAGPVVNGLSVDVEDYFHVSAFERSIAPSDWPRFECRDYFVDPRFATPQKLVATMGMPVDDQGVNQGENLTLACRNALLNMIALLQERGYTREQSYCICSVAVDLRVSNVVDVPNYVVSALLPEEIFQT